jgi:GR25 family glycosyltransferase involved in LPS biosynthesis
MINIKDVYVVHYTKLEERRRKIISQFDGIVDNMVYITDYDQENLSDEVLDKFYKYSVDDWNRKVSDLWDLYQHQPRILNIAEISCTIKHIEAIDMVAKNGDALIIEDDLIIKENFVEYFNFMIESLPDDWDVIMVGTGCEMTAKIETGKILYKMPHPATRCLDSYLISQSAAQKIISTIKPFQLVSDWEVAYHMYLHNLNVYWLEPSPCFQGSEKGVYKSTLR